MKDLDSKVALLSYYVEDVARAACAIPDNYLARLYGRALFLGVDAILKLAPRLKNELRRSGNLNAAAAKQLTEKINKLNTDYEKYYSTIRDKVGAHQQEVDLVLLLEVWNEIDEGTLKILSGDVREIWSALEVGGTASNFARPRELDDIATLEPFSRLQIKGGDTVVGFDRVAITRPSTVGIIPTDLFQEKAMRILTAFDAFNTLIDSGLEKVTSRWYLLEKAAIDLVVVDSCSIIDNLFEDRVAHGVITAEESLVKMWKKANVSGIEELEQFQRDAILEQQLRDLRNKFSAHMDPDLLLVDLESQLKEFPVQALCDYLVKILIVFKNVCRKDFRTHIFLLHGQKVMGFDSIRESESVKPFRVSK